MGVPWHCVSALRLFVFLFCFIRSVFLCRCVLCPRPAATGAISFVRRLWVYGFGSLLFSDEFDAQSLPYLGSDALQVKPYACRIFEHSLKSAHMRIFRTRHKTSEEAATKHRNKYRNEASSHHCNN